VCVIGNFLVSDFQHGNLAYFGRSMANLPKTLKPFLGIELGDVEIIGSEIKARFLDIL
jgi:hypothetical protein